MENGEWKMILVVSHKLRQAHFQLSIFNFQLSTFNFSVSLWKNNRFMTQLIFRNKVDSAKMNTLLAFLQTWGIDAEVQHTPAKTSPHRDIFAHTRGMWVDYDIDIKQIRKQNRERKIKISV